MIGNKRLKVTGSRKPAIRNLIFSNVKMAIVIFGGLSMITIGSYGLSYMHYGYDHDRIVMSMWFIILSLIFTTVCVVVKMIVTDLYGYREIDGFHFDYKIIFNGKRYNYPGYTDIRNAIYILKDPLGTVSVGVIKDPSEGFFRPSAIFFWNQADEEIEEIVKIIRGIATCDPDLEPVDL